MQHNNLIPSALALAFALSTFNSDAAIVSVDIEEFNYTTVAKNQYYRFSVDNKIINNTLFTASPNNTTLVAELDDIDFKQKVGNPPNIRGANVDLLENTSNKNIIEIFLRPMVENSSTHELGITLDFVLDPGQVIASTSYDGGNFWKFFPNAGSPSGTTVANFVTNTISNNGTRLTITYKFPAGGFNVNGVQGHNSISSFDKFTIRLSSPVMVPEPSSLLLLGLGGLTLLRRKRESISK